MVQTENSTAVKIHAKFLAPFHPLNGSMRNISQANLWCTLRTSGVVTQVPMVLDGSSMNELEDFSYLC